MRGIFADAEQVRVVVPESGSPRHRLDEVAALLEREASELLVELGAPVTVVRQGGARPRLELQVDERVGEPQLRLDPAGEVLNATGRDLDGAVEALSLLRTLRCSGQRSVVATPAASVAAAVERLQREVGWTYPAFGLRGIDWAALSDDQRRQVDPDEPLPGLQRWLAHLGDAHTRVQARGPIGHVGYTARVIERSIRFMQVPPGTAAAEVGVRTGDELLDADVADLWSRSGASAHMRAWYVGRLALSGPAGVPRTYRVRRTDGTTTAFTDVPGDLSQPTPVTYRRYGNGTGYLRVAAWPPGVNDRIDDALHELRHAERLLVDLRGNVGGSLVEAVTFRDRFLDVPRRLGAVRFSRGDGELAPASPILGEPSERQRWLRRTRFLTDALTYSASEDAILGLRGLGRIDTAGSPSGGGSGRARTVRLLQGIDLHVSTALTYDQAGHCIEGAGVPIDLPLDLPPDPGAWQAADLSW